ncbi:MAG: CBS domain-containing protein [Methanocellales archaeon]|nr:CBS domain-containing protein [Methanocellales archaeon]MDD5446536.1 CBS domain-containing protein [Methanocellales archaeon]
MNEEMKTSIQLGKIIGIPIRLHISFLLILPLFAYAFATTNTPSGEWMQSHTWGLLNTPIGFGGVGDPLIRYVSGTIVTLLLFSCVLLHELGHSYMAKKHGIGIKSITLIIFGGISSMEEIPPDPRIESKVAVVGPSVSLAIGLSFYFIYGLLEFVSLGIVRASVGMLAFYNFILCGFNLLPAFPMDGGRLLRSWLAKRMSYVDATNKAVSVGKIFALILGMFGLFYGGFWFILIAFFVYIGASEEKKATEVTVTLRGVKVRDIMTADVQIVKPDMLVSELVDLMFKEKHMGYPVVDGNVIGIVTFNDIRQIPSDKRDSIYIANIMTREVISVQPDDDAITALKLLSKHDIGRLIVMEDGVMVGIVSRADLVRSLELLGQMRL